MKGSIAIRTTGLTRIYNEKTAVDHLDLTIPEGELFALLGVNGAGKTTTIRMLSCLTAPTRGTAEIFGHDVSREPDRVKEMIGISTQDTAVAEKLTVEENLRFMAEIYGKNRDAAEGIIRDFGLEEVRSKRAKTLSGGWKRRLSIAMALIGDPKVLFLDEPTLGMDVLARRELWKIISDLKGKTTIILTTHYMEEAEALSDRIGVMIRGRLVELGTLSELEERTGRKGLEEVFVSLPDR
ncbi:MAG: ATP-binding cassette domain-containing protein [Eubacterium sp.]|nr:ATP-binding cassette domain-containing protein [Eubacterium sp.]